VTDEQPHGPVGSFEFEVFGSGRGGRPRRSAFGLRCDAVALHEKVILLLSVAGPETAVKALTAGLRSSGRDQERFGYAVRVGGLDEARLAKCADGYRVYRTKLDYGQWHVLLVARRDGFLPVVTGETLWRHLHGDRFTTPLVREWVPWLSAEMTRRGIISPLTRFGCEAGLVVADGDTLDELVSDGLRTGHLAVPGDRPGRLVRAALPTQIDTLEHYLLAHGPLLRKQAERSLDPLHVPGRDALPASDLLRQPFEAQAHVIEAVRKSLRRQKSVLLVGEMGTGKTLMGIAAVHAHTGGRPYRALVFCPGQLVNKWGREIRETVPGATVIQIESWRTLLTLDRHRKPVGSEWYVIARDRAKLGAKWRPAYQVRTRLTDGFLRCPRCGRRLVDGNRERLCVGRPAQGGHAGTGLWKRRSRCEWVLSDHGIDDDAGESGADRLVPGCGSPLWQMTGEVWRYEPALFIKRRLRHFFHYLIADEVHEEKGADTAQGHAVAALAASCRKAVALTGTLIGGYAEHLRPLLFRLAPGSLIREGLGWPDATAFNERYGRIETRVSASVISSGG
jgi:hypothetical protein